MQGVQVAPGANRIHQVKKVFPYRNSTTVRFICGVVVTYGQLGMHASSELGPEAITCGRCQFVLEQRGQKLQAS